MNGTTISLQNALCEKAGEDCIYKLPIETGTDEICEFEVFDLDSGRFIAKESVRYMPKISWRFDKNLYYEAKDYENAFVRFYDATHGYTESLLCRLWKALCQSGFPSYLSEMIKGNNGIHVNHFG